MYEHLLTFYPHFVVLFLSSLELLLLCLGRLLTKLEWIVVFWFMSFVFGFVFFNCHLLGF